MDKPQFGVKETADLAQMKIQRVQQWCFRGHIATQKKPIGTGNTRLFSLADIGQLSAVRELVDSGVAIDLAFSASAPLSQAVRSHILQIGSWIQSGETLTEEDLISADESILCISTSGEPKILGFHKSVPMPEVLADMGEGFFTFDAERIVRRILQIHVPLFLESISPVGTLYKKRVAELLEAR